MLYYERLFGFCILILLGFVQKDDGYIVGGAACMFVL